MITSKERTRLFIILTLAVFVLTCAIGFVFQQSSWRLTAGLVVVLAADFITYLLYGESLQQIATSNLLTLDISIVLSPFYLAYNETAAKEVSHLLDGMSFSVGSIINGLTGIEQNIPIINFGLAILVACWIVFSLGNKHLNN